MLLAFKILIKVVAIAVVTSFATPYLFGFATGFSILLRRDTQLVPWLCALAFSLLAT